MVPVRVYIVHQTKKRTFFNFFDLRKRQASPFMIDIPWVHMQEKQVATEVDIIAFPGIV